MTQTSVTLLSSETMKLQSFICKQSCFFMTEDEFILPFSLLPSISPVIATQSKKWWFGLSFRLFKKYH